MTWSVYKYRYFLKVTYTIIEEASLQNLIFIKNLHTHAEWKNSGRIHIKNNSDYLQWNGGVVTVRNILNFIHNYFWNF